MKNLTNLDIKRHRLGLKQEMPVLSILSLYKKSGQKKKLELIGLFEVLKHSEIKFTEVLELVYKLEKVTSTEALISLYSMQEIRSRKFVQEEQRHLAKKSSIPVKSPKINYKPIFIVVLGFLSILFLIILFDYSNSDTKKTNIIKKEIKEYVYLRDENGMKYITLSINGHKKEFLLDTGASTILISKRFLRQLKREGFITYSENFIRKKNYSIANGDVISGEVWRLPKIKIGNKVLYNIQISATSMKGTDEDFLFGMSALKKLGIKELDLNNNRILLKTHK